MSAANLLFKETATYHCYSATLWLQQLMEKHKRPALNPICSSQLSLKAVKQGRTAHTSCSSNSSERRVLCAPRGGRRCGFLRCPVLQQGCNRSRCQIQPAGHLANHDAASDQEEALSQESVPTVLRETSPNICQLPLKIYPLTWLEQLLAPVAVSLYNCTP